MTSWMTSQEAEVTAASHVPVIYHPSSATELEPTHHEQTFLLFDTAGTFSAGEESLIYNPQKQAAAWVLNCCIIQAC